MWNNTLAPVILGLAVGIGLILLFGIWLQGTAFTDNNSRPQFQTKYNHTQVPDLHLIVKSDGKRYAGEEGSYCGWGECADYMRIIPERTIVLNKGVEIEFMVINHRLPDEFNAVLGFEDPALQPRCVEEGNQVSCGYPEGVAPPELTKLDGLRYKVDVPSGTYVLFAGGNWIADNENELVDAVYHYKIQVR